MRPQRRGHDDLVLPALVTVLCCGLALGLHVYGRARRSDQRFRALQIAIVRDGKALLDLWAQRGERGREVVSASHYLHFVSPDPTGQILDRTLAGAGTGAALTARYLASASYRNYLAVADATGVARRVRHLVPPSVLATKLADTGVPARPDEERDVSQQVTSRRLSAVVPRLEELVLLNVDASLFEGDAEGLDRSLLDALQTGRLRADLVTLCLSADSPDVGGAARHRLLEFGEALRGVPP
jgi:hypothetical protein